MRRLFLTSLLCVLAAVAAGCGSVGVSGSSGSPGAPEPGERALGAFRATEQAGSVRYSFQATLEGEGTEPVRFSIDGDFARGKGRADVHFDGQGQSLAGTLLYDRGELFVRYLGQWYGEQEVFGEERDLWQDWDTEEAFSARFEELFEGSVREGPVADGVTTWAYNGRLNVDGILNLTAQEAPLDGDAREKLEELARDTRFTFLVGQADGLPRAFLLDLAGEFRFTMRGTFTRWGEPVTVTPPSSYLPLEELFGLFLSF